MHKYLNPLAWIVLVMLSGVSVGYADGPGPTLSETQHWLIDHQNDFTSSCMFSNASRHSFIMTIEKTGLILKKYNPKTTPFPGCFIHFYGNIHVEAYGNNEAYEAIATFRAEDVSDVVEVRKLDRKDFGSEVQDFDAQACYGVVITPKDPNSTALQMTSLGVPYLQGQELNYIVVPVTSYAMAERLANALHHGIHLIQAQMAAKPEPF